MLRLDAKQKKRLRENLLDLVEHRLPRLMRVPVPDSVRTQPWFKNSGIENLFRCYVLHCGKMDVGNGKTPPALKAWLMDEEAGKFDNEPEVLGATSANWGMSSGLIAPIFNVRGFTAVIESSVPQGKRDHLEASGAKIIVAPDGISGTDYVYELIQKDPCYHLIDQYVHEGSILGHKWTMDHITRELKRAHEKASVFGAVTGTCSTLMAAKRYLRKEIKIMGVASMSKAEKVPGSRSPENLDELKKIGGFRYEEAIDFPLVTSVTKDETFAMNAEFIQQYLIPMGPTGALLIAGFYHLLRTHCEGGTVRSLMNPQGNIVFVGFIMDMHLPYLNMPEYLTHFRS